MQKVGGNNLQYVHSSGSNKHKTVESSKTTVWSGGRFRRRRKLREKPKSSRRNKRKRAKKRRKEVITKSVMILLEMQKDSSDPRGTQELRSSDQTRHTIKEAERGSRGNPSHSRRKTRRMNET